MFDRYPGSNREELAIEDKMYFEADGKTVVMPAVNISSFLSAQNTMSAPKRLLGKKAREVCQACLSFVSISPGLIPFMRKGKPVLFSGFNEAGKDEKSGIYIDERVARINKAGNAIPNPKRRPVLPTPWELEFTFSLFQNDEIGEAEVKSVIERGGLALGLGTFRGVYGKFEIAVWK